MSGSVWSKNVLISDLTYKGSWNASTNTPILASGVGTSGYTYRVSTVGTTLIDGISSWAVGDLISFNGTVWEKFPANYAPNILGASAHLIYVAKNGNDSTGDGTLGRPFLTVAAGIAAANSGDTVTIGPGTYVESLIFKAGVNLVSTSRFGTYITGNHVANFTGTVDLYEITLQSATGVTLTFSGTGSQNLQVTEGAINSGTGDAISWSNTNAASKIILDGMVVNVATSGATARCFTSSVGAQGSVIASGTSFNLNNPDNVCLNIAGAISFTHTMDQVNGQMVTSDTAVLNSIQVTHTTNTVPVLVANSSGISVFLGCIDISTASPIITGAGGFAYALTLLPATGAGSASTLNGGIGSVVLQQAPIKIRAGVIKPVPQDGLIEHDSNGFYITQGANRWNLVPTVGTPVASAASIALTGDVFHVTGTTTINTITGGVAGRSITIIPDGLFSTSTSGNIGSVINAVVNVPIRLTFDGTKWY